MVVGGKHHAPAALPQGKTRYPLYRRLDRPQCRSGRVRKISPPTGILSPDLPAVASRCTDWAIPAHRRIDKGIEYCECVCSCLSWPINKSHLFCAALYCHLWAVLICHILFTLSRKRHNFGNTYWISTVCFEFVMFSWYHLSFQEEFIEII